MVRAIIGFLAVWAIVFMGISIFWHSPAEAKLNMLRNLMYSLGTAVVAFAILFGIVVLF